MKRTALAMAALLLLCGCATGKQESRQLAALPEPLTDVKIAYVSDTVGLDQSQRSLTRRPFTNSVDAYGEAEERSRKLGLSKIDGKVQQFMPAILQQHGLKGQVLTFVTPYRAMEVFEAATADAKAKGARSEYWLVISPSATRIGRLSSSAEFRAVLSNLADKTVLWQSDHTLSGTPIDDEQVQTMLITFIKDMPKQP